MAVREGTVQVGTSCGGWQTIGGMNINRTSALYKALNINMEYKDPAGDSSAS